MLEETLFAFGVDYRWLATGSVELPELVPALLLAEGHNMVYVAYQLGPKSTLTLNTYVHVIAELEDKPIIDVNEVIADARDTSGEPSPEQTRRF